MSDRLALANAIEEAGIERSKAERVASVIVAAIYDHAATKADVQASETAVRADLARMDGRIERLDGKVDLIAHRLLLSLGSLMVVLAGLLFAALHYWPPHG